MIQSFNQWDTRWGSKMLGPSNLLCSNYGCYATFVAASLNGLFQKSVDPGSFIDLMNGANGFTLSGDLDWMTLHKLFPDVRMYKGCWTTNHPARDISKTEQEKAIKDIKRAVRMGFGVGLAVDNVKSDGWPDHIVTCIEAPDDLSQWKIMDGDGGQIQLFSKKYGDPMSGVYGYRLLIGPPTVFPSYATPEDMAMGIAAWKAMQVADGNNVQTYSREIVDSLLSA
jgi:hypothetical protein